MMRLITTEDGPELFMEFLMEPTNPVTVFDEELKTELRNMAGLMRALGGVGLAANQVGLKKSMAIVAPSPTEPELMIINPRIMSVNDELIKHKEGCLSIPHIQYTVQRHSSIAIHYQDWEGNHIDRILSGMMAIVAQHEIDHLLGITIEDRFIETWK